jgi:Beta-propeller repeat
VKSKDNEDFMKIRILAGFAVCTLLSRMALTQMPTPPSNQSATLGKPHSQRLLHAYGKLPLSFELNEGQTNQQVKFLSRGAGYEMFLTSTEAVVVMGKATKARHGDTPAEKSKNPLASQLAVLRMQLAGSNALANVRGADELPGTTNYFIGKDASQWHTNIRQYGKVRYHDVYPGVDLVYYGNQGQLEHDFVVAPGADAKLIRFSLNGIEKVSVDKQEDLVLGMSNGEVKLKKPTAYQEIAGVRHEVASRYVLDGSQVSFDVGSYDRSRTLVIDPTLSYLSYLGGSNDDSQASTSLVVDAAGNAYIATGTLSTDFPVTAGAFQTTYGGAPLLCSQNANNICGDVVVTKVSPSGSKLIYSTYLGGSSGEYAFGLAVDKDGAAYIGGYTESADFPVTAGAYQTSFAGRSPSCPPAFFPCGDAFVTKLSPSGAKLVYSTYVGGSGDDYIENLAIDRAGNVYATGSTDSLDYPTTPGAFQTVMPCTFALCGSAFVTKLNASGTALEYSTYLSGTGGSGGGSIGVDQFGNSYVAGSTGSLDFPVTASAFQRRLTPGLCGTPPSFPCPDLFLTKLNSSGNAILYSTYMGGKGSEATYGLALDFESRVYLTGFTASPNFPTTVGAYRTKFGGGTCNAWYGVHCSDVFVAKFDTTKSGRASLVYSTLYGGTKEDQATSVAVNATGNAFITGWTFSNSKALTGDAFLAEFDSTGSKLLFSQLVGGSGFDSGDAVALDGAGNAYIAGHTLSSDLPTTPGVFQPNFGGGPGDCFVAKFKGF